MLSNLQLVFESGDVCLFQKAVKKEVVSVRMHLIQVDIDHIQKTAKGEKEGTDAKIKKKFKQTSRMPIERQRERHRKTD